MDPVPALGGVWAAIVGQPAVATLAAAARDAGSWLAGGASDGSMTHAWLVTGPPGSGRSLAARAFAAALQCPTAGCGDCAACRSVLDGTNADVTTITPSGLSISIADIRETVRRSSLRPVGGRWLVIVIEDADRLTEAAADAMLKAFEEPTERTVWVLCAPAPTSVPPTIRSRARVVSLRVPPAEAVAALLVGEGVDAGIAHFAAAAAQGHIGRARGLATDEETRARRSDVLALPQRLATPGQALAAAGVLLAAAEAAATERCTDLDAAEEALLRQSFGVVAGQRKAPRGFDTALKDLRASHKTRRTRVRRDSLDLALVDLTAFYRDVLVRTVDPSGALVHGDLEREVASAARSMSPTAAATAMDVIRQARDALGRNAAPQLALEAMALRLRSLQLHGRLP